MEQILRYFPKLTEKQKAQLTALGPMYKEWNGKINLVSRKDIDNIYEKHILHSLSIARIVAFEPYTHIMDLGTGGGFPGIPLAILFPKARFHLVDSIAKKILMVNDVIKQLGLTNAYGEQKRVEQIHGRNYDFVVTRAVTKLPQLHEWSKKLIVKGDNCNTINNGIIALKGGDLAEEMKPFGKKVRQYELYDLMPLEVFDTKSIIHLDMSS